MTRITLYFDGLCEPTNPSGYACWAWIALDAGGRTLASAHGCIGHGPGMTNNRAEYTALIRALEYARDHGWQGLTFRGDSQLVINQVTGTWDCRAESLQPLCSEAAELAAGLEATLEWVPRERNALADALSREAYHQAQRELELQR